MRCVEDVNPPVYYFLSTCIVYPFARRVLYKICAYSLYCWTVYWIQRIKLLIFALRVTLVSISRYNHSSLVTGIFNSTSL